MADINWGVIDSLLNDWCKGSEGSTALKIEADKVVLGRVSTKEQVGNVSIQVLSDELLETLQKAIIASKGGYYAGGQLGFDIANELSHLYKSAPYQIGNEYYVDIYFKSDLHRDSLYKEGYPGGVGNIAALLNKGINSNKTKPVRGVWHGDYISGLLQREGTGFIERAKEDFVKLYPYARVEINEEYL